MGGMFQPTAGPSPLMLESELAAARARIKAQDAKIEALEVAVEDVTRCVHSAQDELRKLRESFPLILG